MQLIDLNEYIEDDESEFLAADAVAMPDVIHFMNASQRRDKRIKKQAEIKKTRFNQLDEYELALQG